MKASTWFCRGGHRVTSPFGWRQDPFDPTKKDFHRGIDVSGKVGDPIEAPTRGIVTHAKMYTGYGNLIAVQDRRKHYHLFAHLDKIQAKIGQVVFRGVQIGTKGMTGKATGPHLHYQINTPDGGINGNSYCGNPDDYIYWEDEPVDVILLNTRDDSTAGFWLQRSTGAAIFVRGRGNDVLARAKTVFVVGGDLEPVRDLAPSAELVYLSGANQQLTMLAVLNHLGIQEK